MKQEEIEIALHCLGVYAGREVCEECPVYNQGDVACREAARAAIGIIREVKNYRKIGTLEELARGKKYIELAKKHGTVGELIDECAAYEEIGTVEECREAVEKQKPKKIEYESGSLFCNGFNHYRTGKCPVCRHFYKSDDDINYCSECGQAIKWEEMEYERN